ncbi:unnamed protein product, partial [Musa hybrid cultivar]
RQTQPESDWTRARRGFGPDPGPTRFGSISEPLAQRPARVGPVLCGPVRAGTAQHLKSPRSPADSPSCDQHVRLTTAGSARVDARIQPTASVVTVLAQREPK